MSMRRVPPNCVCMSTMRAGSSRISPMSAASSPPGRCAARRAPRRRRRERRRRGACPRSPRRGVQAQDFARAAARSPEPAAAPPRKQRHSRSRAQFVQHGANAAPRRVAHESAVHPRRLHEAPTSAESGPGYRTDFRFQLEIAARDAGWRCRDRRASRSRESGRPAARMPRERQRRIGEPDARRDDVEAIRPCRARQLRIPVTMETPARSRGSRHRLDLAGGARRVQPLLDDERAARPIGVAPETARSLTVPLTASSPMEPPGKISGRTT